MAKKQNPQRETVTPEPEIPAFYANIVVSNFTPFDLDLVFAKAGLPATLAPGTEAPWQANQKLLARVSLPLALVPAVIKLLERQLERAKAAGIEVKYVEEVKDVEEVEK